MVEVVRYARLDSQIGPIWLAATDNGLCRVSMASDNPHSLLDWLSSQLAGLQVRYDEDGLRSAMRQLGEYFSGARRAFEMRLDMRGTHFQEAVWHQVARIPYGETASYGDVARLIGSPKAARAVGQAVGANPLPIVIPCHRVIGADGGLTGFGSGLKLKRTLLALEGAHPR